MFDQARVVRLLSGVALMFGLIVSGQALADCAYRAESKTSFSVLDPHTVLLRGGSGPDILVKTLTAVNNVANLTVLKDSFCNYDEAVLYADGQVVDAGTVIDLR